MVFIWINEGDGWEPHASFETSTDGSSWMTDAEAEIADLREQGIKAKTGPSFYSERSAEMRNPYAHY
jgi:hypothetical protein|tara:strand:- start:500 stop:700 length:201 start_codon:yes stop_codon:yes gene_type:complete